MTTLTEREIELLCEYIMEVDAIIDADDGTYFPMPFLDKHEEIKELFL